MLRWTSSRSTLPGEVAALDLLADRRQAALDRRQVGRRDHLAVGEHRRVGEAAGDVGAPEALVEARRWPCSAGRARSSAPRTAPTRPRIFSRIGSRTCISKLPGRGKRGDPHGSMSSRAQHEPHGRASVGDNPEHVSRQDSLDSIGAVSSPMSMSVAASASPPAMRRRARPASARRCSTSSCPTRSRPARPGIGVRRLPCRRRPARDAVRPRRDGDRHGLRRDDVLDLARR